jgi:outer membrane protein OmpA-like peptidoglycan-associated protein
MSTGTFSNRFSFVGRHGFKALGLAVLSAGLFLGGCNGKLKDENEALRTENATIKEKLTSTETTNATLATTVEQTKAEKDRLAAENATLAARASQAPMGTTYQNSDQGWQNNPGPSGRRERGGSGNGGGDNRFTIAGDALFGPGSASLKGDAKKSIDGLLPQIKSAHSVKIEGYTDSDPIRSAKAKYPTNAALSKARADAVKSYLVSRGVSSSKITTVGKGSSDPKSTKKESRRVEIVVAE